MRADEFRNEWMRLERGFGRDRNATDERLRSLFGFLGHYEISEMRSAVDRLLCDDRMPSFERIHAALEHASERRRARRRSQESADAQRVMDGSSPALGGSGVTREELAGLKAFRAICDKAIEERVSPRETAEFVAAITPRWPWLKAEVDALVDMGDTWKNARGEAFSGDLDAIESSRNRSPVHAAAASLFGAVVVAGMAFLSASGRG